MWVKGICDIWKNVLNGNIVCRHFKFKRKFNIVCNYYFHFLYHRLSTFHQQHCFVQSTLLSVISSRWQTKRSLTFNTKKHFSVHGSDFKSFPVLFDCMFVIASGMFGCLLTAVGCAFGDEQTVVVGCFFFFFCFFFVVVVVVFFLKTLNFCFCSWGGGRDGGDFSSCPVLFVLSMSLLLRKYFCFS